MRLILRFHAFDKVLVPNLVNLKQFLVLVTKFLSYIAARILELDGLSFSEHDSGVSDPEIELGYLPHFVVEEAV